MEVIFRPRLTTASASPTWRYSSSVRACTARARDVVPGSEVLSTMRTRMPSRVSHRANTKPVGPAPTMRTSVSFSATTFLIQYGTHRFLHAESQVRGSGWLGGWRFGGMRERRRRVAANNRRGFVDKRVIFESRHHEEGKVHAARDVARQDGVANVPTPDWQTLTLTFFEVAPLTTVHLVLLAN